MRGTGQTLPWETAHQDQDRTGTDTNAQHTYAHMHPPHHPPTTQVHAWSTEWPERDPPLELCVPACDVVPDVGQVASHVGEVEVVDPGAVAQAARQHDLKHDQEGLGGGSGGGGEGASGPVSKGAGKWTD